MHARRFLAAAICQSLLATSVAADLALDPDLARLLERVEETRLRFDVPAVGLTLVSSDEVLWAGAIGVSDIKTRQPVTGDTIFRIGSITKSFTSLALLIAAGEGDLDLNEPVRTILPDPPYTNRWEDTRPIRLAYLLEHTAGFHDMTRAEFDHSDPTPLSLEEALAFSPESRTVQWPPGVHSSYSNSGAGVAAYVLEQSTGRLYEQFVEERIFEPLGMSSAGFFLDEATLESLAQGYQADGHTEIPYWHMIFRPFGGINTTPRDMAAFLQLLINEGEYRGRRLVDTASIRRMETPHTTLAGEAGLEFGYGLGNYAWTHDGMVFHGHGGDGDGYLAHYGYNRETGLGYFVVVTVFNHRPLREMRELIEDYITSGLEPPGPSLRTELSQDTLRALTGVYEPATTRFAWTGARKPASMRISLADGILFTQTGSGRKRALIPVNGDLHFRRRDEPVATAAFVTDEQGNLFLQGRMGNYRRTTR